MLKNYLKIALRNLRKQKLNAFINIAGLALGLAAGILIVLYTRHELTYDRFHDQADRIYHVYKERITPTGTQETYDMWMPLLGRLRQTFPSVVNGARVVSTDLWVQHGDQRFEEEVTYADPSLFEVFTFPLEQGNRQEPLPQLNAVVIAPELIRKYFGDEDPIGKILTLSQIDYTVTGVLAETPSNSTIDLGLVVPIQSASWYAEAEDYWDSSFSGLDTYILLDESASVEALEAQFPAFIEDIWDAETASQINFKVLPLVERYEALRGRRDYAYVLLGIAAGIILIVCINFMNLTTARSLDRAREIGMRKVLGAFRGQLMLQFLGESLLLTLLALIVGLGLAQLAIPAFNVLYDIELSLDLFGSPPMLLYVLVLGIIVGVFAGSYPAFYLSRLRSVESLKGALKRSAGGFRFRDGLVVVQFAISVALIVGTGVMWRQVDYMKHTDLSFDKENIVVLPVDVRDFADPEQAAVRLESFKDELARLSNVISVSSSSHIPSDWDAWFDYAYPEGGDEQAPMWMRLAFMDARYFDTYGIAFIEGRNFMEGSEQDRRQSVIINKAALTAFGWRSAAGKTVRHGDKDFEVIGVVENYHFESLENEVHPVLHVYRPPENGVHNFLSVRISPGDYRTTLASIREKWQALAPSRRFEYFFIDDNVARLYEAQDRLLTVAGAFSVLAITVACLGLFGLVSLVVAQRTKEIGIRKILGASAGSIVALLSKDFLKLVLAGVAVAVPVVYFAMSRWLEDFAYRIEIGPWAFVLAGVLAVAIALLTVGYQAAKAALADPVKALRYE